MTDGIPGALHEIGRQNPHLAMAMKIAADKIERLETERVDKARAWDMSDTKNQETERLRAARCGTVAITSGVEPMMKIFCDGCSEEVTGGEDRVRRELTLGDHNVLVEVMVRFNNVWNDGNL